MTTNTPRVPPPAPEIYPAPEGILNYLDLVPQGSLVDIALGPWEDADRTDTLYLYLDGEIIESYPSAGSNGYKVISVAGSVFSGELDPTTDLFDNDGVHEVTFLVGYIGGGNSGISLPATVTVKCSKPGGSHEQPVDQVNEKLAEIVLTPPEADEQTTAMTLTIAPWTHMAVGDTVRAYFSGEPFDFLPVTTIGVPQTRELTQAELQTIPSGDNILVAYRIVDLAGNSSGYAPSVTTSIWTDTSDTLEASELYYSDHDTLIAPGDTIDVEAAGMAPLESRVLRYEGWPGQTVTAYVESRPPEGGDPDILGLGTITWSGQGHLSFEVPVEWILDHQGGNLRCWYVTDGSGRSTNTRYLVGRLPIVTPLAPIVSLQNEGVLDPDLIIGAFLTIEAPGGEYFVPYARCTMRITGIASDGTDVEWEYYDEAPSVPEPSMYFFCEKEIIEQLRDRPARFSYTIESTGRPLQSADLLLVIGKAGAPGMLPPPQIYGLEDGVLDPAQPMLRVTIPASTAARTGAIATLFLQADTDLQQTKQFLADLEPIHFNLANYPALHNGEQVDASYTVLWTDGETISASQSEVFYIGSPLRFGKPIVQEASNDTLDPFDALTHATVLPAADAGLQPTDTYVVRTERASTGSELYRSATTAGSTASVNIPPEAFSACLGATCNVNYEVTRDGRTTPSEKRMLTITAIPDNDTRLPRVAVTEGPDRELDLSGFVGDANYTVAAWTWMHVDQRYWITCQGSGEDGTPLTDLKLAEGVTVTRGEVTTGLAGKIARAWLDLLGEGSLLKISLRVTFDGSTELSDAVTFRTTELTVLKQAGFEAPVFLEAVGNEVDPSKPVTIATEPNVRVTTGLYYWASVLSLQGGTEIPYQIASASRITATDQAIGVRLAVPPSILATLPVGSALKILFSVNLVGTDDPFNATDFPPGLEYRIGEGDGEEVTENFDQLNPGTITPIKVGQTLNLTHMDITFTAAAIRPDENTIGVETFGYSLPGYYDKVVLYIGHPQGQPNDNTTTIRFKQNWRNVRFAMTSLDSTAGIEWLNEQDGVIATETIAGGDVTAGFDVTHGENTAVIRGVRIKSTDRICLDFFRLQGGESTGGGPDPNPYFPDPNPSFGP